VRIVAKPTNPIKLKKHRDISVYEYKQDYYVENDGNYCVCVYEGINVNGELCRNVIVENNISAAKRFLNKNSDERRIPKIDENGYSLKYVLKIGTKVLFYEKCYSELLNCSDSELKKRLYKVYGLWKDYRILLTNVQETINIKSKAGAWKLNDEYRPSMMVASSQFNALIEGIHFKMSESGKITFLID
jgi:CRISPR-associated endonuclease Csn1